MVRRAVRTMPETFGRDERRKRKQSGVWNGRLLSVRSVRAKQTPPFTETVTDRLNHSAHGLWFYGSAAKTLRDETQDTLRVSLARKAQWPTPANGENCGREPTGL